MSWLTRISFVSLLALSASACSPNLPRTTIVAPPPAPTIDARLLVRCTGPTDASGELTAAKAQELWNTDRTRLRVCVNRHGGLVEAVEAE